MNEVLAERPALFAGVDWDWYEAEAAALVVYDDSSRQTIQGVPLEMRMALGLFEEHSEMLHDDSPADVGVSTYRRSEALVNGRTYVDGFSSDDGGVEQIVFHQNEFGDFLWFMVNYASHFGIKIGEAVRDYGSIAELDSLPAVAVSSREFAAQPDYSQEYVWFRNSAHRLFEMVGMLTNRETASAGIDPAAKSALAKSVGTHVMAMALLAESTFGVSIADIMSMNVRKIYGRRERGTVVHGNGDGR